MEPLTSGTDLSARHFAAINYHLEKSSTLIADVKLPMESLAVCRVLELFVHIIDCAPQASLDGLNSQTIQLALLGEVGTKQEIAGFLFFLPWSIPNLISATGFANRCAIKARNTKTVSPKFRVLRLFSVFRSPFHSYPRGILDNFLQKQVVEDMRKQGSYFISH
jgi:hypothetical protein